MSRTIVLAVALSGVSSLVLLTQPLFAQDARGEATDDHGDTSDDQAIGVSKKLAKALSAGDIRIALKPLVPDARRRLGWSPKGSQVPLIQADGRWYGKISLKQRRVQLRFRTPDKRGAEAELDLDLNGNGKFEAGERTTIKGRLSRGKHWYSSTATLDLPFGEGTRSYPISIWYVDDPESESKREVIRWSRRGWHEGTFDFQGTQCTVLVTDRLMDGVFDLRDSWGIGTSPDEARGYKQSTASVAGHNWLTGVAFQVKEVDPNGRFVIIHAFDLGRTEEEDRKQRDPYAKDRTYPRAKAPVRFRNDLDAALAEARRENKRVLIDFVTTWCGPCAVMDQLVYTAQPVVDTQASTIFVKLDGDKEKELRKKYAVRAYPTVILLDAKANVVKTAVGYQSVEKLLAILE